MDYQDDQSVIVSTLLTGSLKTLGREMHETSPFVRLKRFAYVDNVLFYAVDSDGSYGRRYELQ